IDPATGLAPLEAMKGFLPVNDKEKHNGEGFVTFFMKPVADAATRDSIRAVASIVFDTNEAIETNVWVNTLDAAPPASQLQGARDNNDQSLYHLSFNATDDANGSGVKQIMVYYSENKAPYKELAVCRPDSVLDFTMETSGEYAFYSIAEDHTGNREANKETPDFAINANTAPTDILLSNTVFNDDIALHGFIAELSAIDAESNPRFEYALAEGDGAIHNDLFRVSGSQLQTATPFKCAEDTEYQIRLGVTDAGGLHFEKAFTLQLNQILLKPEPVSFSVAICEGDSYDFFGTSYSQTGSYTYRKEKEFTCDSVYVLNLTVNPYPSAPVVTVEGTHTLVSSALNGNQWYDENGPVEGATEPAFTPVVTGRYYVTASGETCESAPSATYYVNLSDETRLQWDFAQYWNWISINTSEAIGVQSLLNPVKTQVDRIKGAGSESIYDSGSGFSGNLTALSAQHAYKLKMNDPATLILQGSVCSIAETTIDLQKGWNWIGYLPVVEFASKEALANLTAESGEVIKNQNDFAVFDGQKWVGTLTRLKPGEGYMYLAASAKSLTYSPVRAVQVEDPGLRDSEILTWEFDSHRYRDNMNVIARLYVNNQTPESGIFTVGAFQGDECRGIGEYAGGKLFITVHGEIPGENITFRAIENASQQIYDINETLVFADTVKGDLNQPFQLNLKGTNIPNVAAPSFIVYPNPVRNKLYISGIDRNKVETVKILNVSGNVVSVTDNAVCEQGLDVTSLAEGSYIIAVATEEGMLYRKFIKK
ncbi:MAG: T9SS type A sorting domain-containing protein, partial [Dysgonamonadaceae bacterium]|nr:T9SS type A sorting domain-containing protein [Dysgonamonadaceae bacterium]